MTDTRQTGPSNGRVSASRLFPDASSELAARRTGMSFQRTRMSADRTLMSVMRTALSLIGFGFTIFQVFQKAHDAQIIRSSRAAGAFGKALVVLGSAMLVVGIWYHIRFMLELRREREALRAEGIIHAQSAYPYSMTLITAVLLLLLGLVAIVSMVFHAGPLA